MIAVVLRILVRLALCAAVSWVLWHYLGLAVAVASAPLYGIALARPLLDLASELRHQTRAAVWRPLEGRHFVYRGTPLQVLEDDSHQRWVRAADVRRILGRGASDATLASSYPNGWRSYGQPAEPHFSDDALIAHLAKASTPEALRFRRWAERAIAFPARRQRERLGIRPAAPQSARDDD